MYYQFVFLKCYHLQKIQRDKTKEMIQTYALLYIITAIVVIVGIGQKFYTFLKFCTLENTLE